VIFSQRSRVVTGFEGLDSVGSELGFIGGSNQVDDGAVLETMETKVISFQKIVVLLLRRLFSP
jgi:hypothetical protein